MTYLESLRQKIFICALLALLGYLICTYFLVPKVDNSDFRRLVSNNDNTDLGARVTTNESAPIYLDFKDLNKDQVPQNVLQRLWFMPGGDMEPRPNGAARDIPIWPKELSGSDRVLNQLMFVPTNYSRNTKEKKILLYHHEWLPPAYSIKYEEGSNWFKKHKCPVDTCSFTYSKEEAATADMIILLDREYTLNWHRSPQQVWLFHITEPPYKSRLMKRKDVYNWTTSYRPDSDIVMPYGKWVYFNNSHRQTNKPDKNYAQGKSQQVAWIVSNCNAHNLRIQYGRELQKYIQVHIYGQCGDTGCHPDEDTCLNMLDTAYKFYLAFENSNCNKYITEKLFKNSYLHNILPIVMGARPEDYADVAPFHSYIHVDEFNSPMELAEYLHKLDKDDELYNSYFLWKGTGQFIRKTLYACRVCAMLHSNYPVKSYSDINEWWRAPGTCTRGSWREFNQTELVPWQTW